MGNRFTNMVKVPKEPAAKLLSMANTRLDTPITAPVAALPDVVLEELDEKGAMIDLIRLLSILLPPRERVWWACMAARDYVGPKSKNDPKSLTASEDWVFKPTEENRERARLSMDEAYIDDDTVNIALSVVYSDGTLGPADLAEYPAPAGAAETSAFAMNIVALDKNSDRFEEYGQMLIDRAVDIARGGNGRMENKDKMEEATP
ncbi:hypothetical protein HKX54_19185 [Sulfitobacter sp. M57]|uniref:DUF6931 family protein n=2 Tax=unclassified Sulfitobacter TaxID=196795 RepID=UPI0023E2BDF5|nr:MULTISPECIES: hypothetical protein [unclassified Sulfitobacter]MDF3460788.1 hypothetical protein [Sulfitobacter sp. S74]MDF3480132.1 hypothetical protein [Sulfitobacter sp. M53]MDF3487927.1 hypothetical protein [Sulfitobacter sp. Ks13]MDF3416603.1 hypothetical protein [Sulfitobacter sp. KE5]MDF3424083.1 hypothetical protein [Sulfitobacter sp. KE43]